MPKRTKEFVDGQGRIKIVPIKPKSGRTPAQVRKRMEDLGMHEALIQLALDKMKAAKK